MTRDDALAHIRHLPWLLAGSTLCVLSIPSSVARSIFAWLLEGEVVVVDNALAYSRHPQ